MKFALAAALALSALPSCAVTRSGTTVKADVTRMQYDRAVQIVRSIGFLPKLDAKKNCEDRAYFMAMALAAEGIPSTSLFVTTAKPSQRLKLADGTLWTFHVAPMIRLVEGAAAAEPSVLDPILAPEGPLTQAVWLDKMRHGGAQLVLLRNHGSDYGWPSLLDVRPDEVPTWETLKPFEVNVVKQMCNELAADAAKLAPASAKSAQEALVALTSTYVAALEAKGKLANIFQQQAIVCDGKVIPIP